MVPLLTKEINEFVMHWNSHHIRPSTYAISPGGVPEDLFDMPDYYGIYAHIIIIIQDPYALFLSV